MQSRSTLVWSAAPLAALAAASLAAPKRTAAVVTAGFGHVAGGLGALWQWLFVAVALVAVGLAVSPWGRARLGHGTVLYSLPGWIAVLLCTLLAGVPTSRPQEVAPTPSSGKVVPSGVERIAMSDTPSVEWTVCLKTPYGPPARARRPALVLALVSGRAPRLPAERTSLSTQDADMQISQVHAPLSPCLQSASA